MLFSMDQSEASNCARTPEELAFLHAVELSDITTTRRLMAENPTLNVDVIDALGRTALRLAVRNENREVSFLYFSCLFCLVLIIMMYIYHALINALSAHMIHINLNMIF